MLKALKQKLSEHKKLATILGIITVVVLLGATIAWLFWRNTLTNRPLGELTRTAENAQPVTKKSPLTGLDVSIELADRPVLGVMVENSPDARPQSGLSESGIVFETVAEGGITRYLVLYQEHNPLSIGPIRSLRIYYLDWALGFDAGIAHVGGSAEALERVRSGGRDLDQFFNSSAYDRIPERYAPHNVYSSAERLFQLMRDKGYTSSNFTPYARTQQETPVNPPTAPQISVTYSSSLYDARFDYNPANNSYVRFLDGIADIDAGTGTQIELKNVVAVRMPSGYSGQYALLETIGTGTVTVFRDGQAIEGTWRKTSPAAQLELLDAAGAAIQLNPGSTWFCVIPSTTGEISY